MNKWRISIAMFVALLSAGQIALGATEISGNIEGDTTWSLAGSPYIITQQIVVGTEDSPADLTIEPGVTIKFESDTWLAVTGKLTANGTKESKIHLTSNANDNEIHPWSVVILNSSGNNISNTITSYSRDGLQVINGFLSISDSYFYRNNNSLIIDRSILSIRDSKVEESNPILILDSNASLENIEAIKSGILSSGSILDIKNILIENSRSSGIAIYSSSTVQIKDSELTSGDGEGIIVSESELDIKNTKINNFKGDGLVTYNESILNGKNLDITDNSGYGIANYASRAGILDSKILNNSIGLANYGQLNINNSHISGNSIGAQAYSSGPIYASNNFWGDRSGPQHETTNPQGAGDMITDNVYYTPWLIEFCEIDCHSNIMFLPGIMASRLYEGDNQIWEPNLLTRDSEFEKLYLDETGNSINSNIVTKDVLDNHYAYEKLINDLNALKSSNTINDYEAVPYDWRLSIADILNTGTKQNDDTIKYGNSTNKPYIEKTLRELAASSKSGKVTIVAHSNGGLLTKALINKLGDEASILIDKVILVAVPQLGTPQAIGALLHGYEAGKPTDLPLVLTESRARDLAINMPMIYQLMPFSDYYNSAGATIGIPYVTFEDGSATQNFIDNYGYAITSGELFDFLTGEEGRSTPSYEDLNNLSLANSGLLSEAQNFQQGINSTWQPPEGIEIHQIAGIGEQTLAGITYKTIKKCKSHILFVCKTYEDTLSYEPNIVLDGDGTVVVPSALAMSDSDPDVNRWWVNLQDYNNTIIKSIPGLDFLRTKHADILEINELRTFILNNLLTKNSDFLPENILENVPKIEGADRLNFTLHSPLSLSAIDENGNITGKESSSIPGAIYTRYGEVQTLSIPKGIKFTVVLKGESEGSFTLEMKEFEDDEIIASSTFSAIPTSTSTIASIEFNTNELENAGILEVDYNGDFIVDLNYTPILGQTVLVPDIIVADSSIKKTFSSGYFKKQPYNLETSLNLKELTDMVIKIQTITVFLSSLENQISKEQHSNIKIQLQTILNTLITLLQAQQGIK